MRTLFSLLLTVLTFAAPAGHGAEPWLRKDDVVALVGGEDMVALAEEGWLETLVTWAQPKDRIRWRSLAWEGDTVFEQRRDLNYPALETQLDKMGATVVICQFGKMESFAGKEGVAAFTEAYEKLLKRLNPEGKRRIALMQSDLGPLIQQSPRLLLPDFKRLEEDLAAYGKAVTALAMKHHLQVIGLGPPAPVSGDDPRFSTRDGIHPRPEEQFIMAHSIYGALAADRDWARAGTPIRPQKLDAMRAAIQAKNRLWFHYTRPQNWAFLAGNRTNQPSSRDHKDPTKRWFPEEMEQWVPLIEAKEREVWKLAEAPR